MTERGILFGRAPPTAAAVIIIIIIIIIIGHLRWLFFGI
jgi:hypothetical protein